MRSEEGADAEEASRREGKPKPMHSIRDPRSKKKSKIDVVLHSFLLYKMAWYTILSQRCLFLVYCLRDIGHIFPIILIFNKEKYA